jgi:hypothetical protein
MAMQLEANKGNKGKSAGMRDSVTLREYGGNRSATSFFLDVNIELLKLSAKSM